jgi:hypothetical protein
MQPTNREVAVARLCAHGRSFGCTRSDQRHGRLWVAHISVRCNGSGTAVVTERPFVPGDRCQAALARVARSASKNGGPSGPQRLTSVSRPTPRRRSRMCTGRFRGALRSTLKDLVGRHHQIPAHQNAPSPPVRRSGWRRQEQGLKVSRTVRERRRSGCPHSPMARRAFRYKARARRRCWATKALTHLWHRPKLWPRRRTVSLEVRMKHDCSLRLHVGLNILAFANRERGLLFFRSKLSRDVG